MKMVKGILRHINVLNAILLTLAVVLFFALAYPLLMFETPVDLPKIKTLREGKINSLNPEALPSIEEFLIVDADLFSKPLLLVFAKSGKTKIKDLKDLALNAEEMKTAEHAPTVMDYEPVSEKNLFHPERRMPTDKKAEKDVVRPEIIFYGAVITSDKRIAYIEDKKNPYSTPGRGKRQVAVAEGATVGGYKVKEVNPESLVLVRGEDVLIVNLRDQKDRKTSESTMSAVPSVTSQPRKPLTYPAARPSTAPRPFPPRPALRR